MNSREAVMAQERYERERYISADPKAPVMLPITKDGFEALLAVASKVNELPVDDMARSVLAGYMHHIDNDKNTTTIDTVATVLYKSYSNNVSWVIDQEVKQRRAEEQRAQMKLVQDEQAQAAQTAPTNSPA